MIFNNYCSSELKMSLQELPNFEREIKENPIKLLEKIENRMHVPMRVVYPIHVLLNLQQA